MGNHITLSQLDAAAPESSYPLGDKIVSQPALSQTLVGHSVIVVRRVQGCIYVDSHRNLRRNLGQLRIKSQIDLQPCESKINKNMLPKRHSENAKLRQHLMPYVVIITSLHI